MSITELRLTAIAARLTQTIPAPARAIARPQASWRTLKPGDLLTYKDGGISPWCDFPPGHRYVILSVDSLGMTLAKCAGDASVPTTSARLRWEQPDWADAFTKLPKRRKKKDDKSIHAEKDVV